MTVKRRNHGRNKKNRGHVKRVHCVSTAKLIPKDKAIKRFVVRYVCPSNATLYCAAILLRFLEFGFSARDEFCTDVVPPCSNIVDASAMRDLKEASVYETYALPKIYIKNYYSIEAAIHQRIVRVRSAEGRRNREPPARIRPKKL
ncbi:hypothetical protein DYB32_003521 [Aphanomyces invadans]|uniref:40S ribosomal protein S26 n=1 Tax=Aphanomyces invadans TaxID=157072 RepID=A0A418B0B4_9STRA|nr:hypothetical protein DYB32_003521 [Aphanomyces invadans]